jgi:protein tyrosine/serine phosphatase
VSNHSNEAVPKNLFVKDPPGDLNESISDTRAFAEEIVYDDKKRNITDGKRLKMHSFLRLFFTFRFFSVMDNFLRDPQSQRRIVVVHCTHGVNRTGFLVAMYLVVRRGYQPADAISG